MIIMMILNMSISYFHTKICLIICEDCLMMNPTLGSDMPQLIVTTLGTSNQAIPPIEELPIASPIARNQFGPILC
jgi:hypothetical protein